MLLDGTRRLLDIPGSRMVGGPSGTPRLPDRRRTFGGSSARSRYPKGCAGLNPPGSAVIGGLRCGLEGSHPSYAVVAERERQVRDPLKLR